MKHQFLLIEDVDDLGRSGDLVQVKPGYARNYLLPQKKALMATPHTLRLQEQLRQERSKKAVVDRQEAEILAAKIEGMTLDVDVKVDPEGRMYGSVNAGDIVSLLHQKDVMIERRHVQLPRPLKELGVHPIDLKLNEGVIAHIIIQIKSDAAGLKGEEKGA